ncbi:hypothetical protein SAMN05442782_5176 [Streptomyces sp. OK228]|nr:hypothetical protein SAMN05442782_5176 [Streptomyces sp. OK228]
MGCMSGALDPRPHHVRYDPADVRAYVAQRKNDDQAAA